MRVILAFIIGIAYTLIMYILAKIFYSIEREKENWRIECLRRLDNHFKRKPKQYSSMEEYRKYPHHLESRLKDKFGEKKNGKY